MNLTDHYNQLWQQSLEGFRDGRFDCDPYLQDKEDIRYGLTLRAMPSPGVKASVTKALTDIQSVAPGQYFYPASDLHITVLPVISCSAGFTLDAINPEAYFDTIERVTQKAGPFRIRFRGLTASSSCIMVQGFPEDNLLNEMRDNLRREFNQSALRHSIDKRYPLQTAHMTAIRFRQPPNHPEKFIEKLTTYREQDFGSCIIDELELVGNDWYQREVNLEMIRRLEIA